MTLKIPTDTQAITWLIIGIFSAWGGVVRYLMDMQGHRGSWSWM